jgi:hypothetical protein
LVKTKVFSTLLASRPTNRRGPSTISLRWAWRRHHKVPSVYYAALSGQIHSMNPKHGPLRDASYTDWRVLGE